MNRLGQGRPLGLTLDRYEPPVHTMCPSALPDLKAVKSLLSQKKPLIVPDRIRVPFVKVEGTAELGGKGAKSASRGVPSYTSITPLE